MFKSKTTTKPKKKEEKNRQKNLSVTLLFRSIFVTDSQNLKKVHFVSHKTFNFTFVTIYVQMIP